MQHKNYMDIQAFKNNFLEAFSKGDNIVIQEKIDGANASFQYDTETDSLISFSRKKILDEGNTLRGFKTMVDLMDKKPYEKFSAFRFFGEWLVKHTVQYPVECYNKFYLFDVFNTETSEWLGFERVVELAKELTLTMVPLFYDGKFQSWEHVLDFTGQTALGGDYGEGVVVKNMTRINDPNNRLPFYTKLVTANFKEKAKAKIKEPLDPNELARIQYEKELTTTIVTRQRVQKLLHKLVDENVLPESWGFKEMGIVAKNLPRAAYADCLKEEREIVEQVGSGFGKYCQAAVMAHAKDIITIV